MRAGSLTLTCSLLTLSPCPAMIIALQLESQIAAFNDWLTGTLRLKHGDRVVLSFPPGLKFLVAFLSCLATGIIAGGCCAKWDSIAATAKPTPLGVGVGAAAPARVAA